MFTYLWPPCAKCAHSARSRDSVSHSATFEKVDKTFTLALSEVVRYQTGETFPLAESQALRQNLYGKRAIL